MPFQSIPSSREAISKIACEKMNRDEEKAEWTTTRFLSRPSVVRRDLKM